MFQARQFALGVQGQVYIGGLFATLIAFSPLGTTWIALPAGILAAMIGGAVMGFIPGYAKSRLGANEIVSSLMLNYIAYDVCNYFLRVYLASLESGLTTSAALPAAIDLSGLHPAHPR